MSSVCFVIITSKFQLPIDTLLTFLWKTKEKWGKQVCVHFTWLNVSFAGPSIAITASFISLMARSLRFTFANDLNLNVWSTIWRAKWVLFIRDRTQGSSLQWCPFLSRSLIKHMMKSTTVCPFPLFAISVFQGRHLHARLNWKTNVWVYWESQKS